MSKNFETLKSHILLLSQSSNFTQAKEEWEIVGVELHKSFTHCPCGKKIKELCYIKNYLNGNRTHVGNICINHFNGLSTGNLFPGLRRIAKNSTVNANQDVIEYAYQLGYIYERERKFLIDTQKKTKTV